MNDQEFKAFLGSPNINAFDPSSMAGGLQEHNQSIFGESLSSEPQGMPSFEDSFQSFLQASFEDSFQSFLQERSQGAEGSELEEDASADQDSTSGFLAPTNFSVDQVVAHLPGLESALESSSWLLDRGTSAFEHAVESGSLFAKDKFEALSDMVQDKVHEAWDDWNASDNSLHNALDQKIEETVENANEWANDVGRSEFWARVKQRYNQAIDNASAFTERLTASLGYGASASDIAKEEAALESAQSRLADNLMDLTQDPDFEATIKTAFGDQADVDQAEELIERIAEGKGGPEIEVIDGEKLEGLGAFGNGRVFISDETVAKSADNPEVFDRVLLEEVGHYLDQELNDVDSPGDEGEIFAGLAQEKTFSEEELQNLKNEDDSSALIIDGKTIVVENSEPSDEERDREIARLEAEAEQLATVSPYASQEMLQEAQELREIAKLEEASDQLTTASPYASQAMNEEAGELREETHFYSNADQSDVLLSYSSSESMLTGERVEQWQQDLKDLGYDIDVDGYFGAQTDAITKQFQRDNDLAVDGIVGPNTLAVIEAASSNVDLTPSEVIPGVDAPLGPVADAINGVVESDSSPNREPPSHGAPPPLDGQSSPLDHLSEGYNVENFLDDPPNWVSDDILAEMLTDPELANQLAFLHASTEIPLNDFLDISEDAEDYPQFDWRNDGCSSIIGPLLDIQYESACIRHDFAYRNFERIDAQFGLDGTLHEKVKEFENVSDDRLGIDASNLPPPWDLEGKYIGAQLIEEGVELPGNGADSDWTGQGWNDAGSPYEDDSNPPSQLPSRQSGHVPAPASPGQSVPDTSAFDDDPNVNNAGVPERR